MKNKNSIFLLLTLFMSFSFFILPSFAIDNPDYIEIIGAGDEIYFQFNLTQNDELAIEFEVTAGSNKDVDFYILTSENFVKWDNSESFSYIVFRNRAVYANINFIVPNNGTFYVIFSNSFSIFTSKTVEIDFTINPESINGVDFPMEVLVMIIIPVAIIIVLTFLIIRYKKRQIPKEGLISKKQDRITEDQDNQATKKNLCPLCGEQILDGEGDYCSKCGGALK